MHTTGWFMFAPVGVNNALIPRTRTWTVTPWTDLAEIESLSNHRIFNSKLHRFIPIGWTAYKRWYCEPFLLEHKAKEKTGFLDQGCWLQSHEMSLTDTSPREWKRVLRVNLKPNRSQNDKWVTAVFYTKWSQVSSLLVHISASALAQKKHWELWKRPFRKKSILVSDSFASSGRCTQSQQFWSGLWKSATSDGQEASHSAKSLLGLHRSAPRKLKG